MFFTCRDDSDPVASRSQHPDFSMTSGSFAAAGLQFVSLAETDVVEAIVD
jgi:hypothetical protein